MPKITRRYETENPTKTLVVLWDEEELADGTPAKKVLDIIEFDEVLLDKDDDYFYNLKGEYMVDRIVEVLVEYT